MSVHASEGSETEDSIDNVSTQIPRVRRSKVWEHFENDLVNVDGDLKAVCKYCGLKLHAKSGTSSLRGHIAESCPEIEEDVRKRFIVTMKKQPSDDLFVFDPQVCRDRMINFCIHAEIPFKKFEDPYLQPWIDSMQPVFKVKSRQTIRNDCFEKYTEMKRGLQDDLSNLDSRVCITSDMWTSSQNLGYMAVTAHYIDAEFNLHKKIISFKEVKYPHTGYAIEEAIVSSLTDWGIREKLFTVTVDNASNNTSACEELVKNNRSILLCEGEHLHVRCSAHILNILVQDGMKIIHAAINKIRELLRHIDSSPSRLQTFNSLANANGLAPKHGLYIDVLNRWNATFKMTKEALEYKSALNNYAKQNLEACPSELEWDRAEAICKFLKAIEELTVAVSAHRRPTSHKFLPVVLCMRHALREPRWQHDSAILKDVAAAMQVKLDKYWDPYEDFLDPLHRNNEIEFYLALVIATILDPRRKDVYLEFFYEKVANYLDQVPTLIDRALKCMRKYFDEYQQVLRTSTASLSQRSCEYNVNLSSPIVGKRKLEEEFAQHKSRRKYARMQKSEIDIYLEEATMEDNEDFDILVWWKRHAEKFPVLSAMARDFLAIPLSTVASESAFSCGGRILGDTRSSLTPKMLEALICTKDWLYKPNDGQHPTLN